jgi:A/G-specific adenine glycosylase
MLQQTQVERVLPKYREFLEAFPSVADLAAAPRSEVIRRWAPLGYNLRAVRLHEVARQVVERWEGRFPETEDGLLALKGIGPYTAGAVMCFAYRKPSVFLDTNLRRVLGRCFAGIPSPRPDRDREILAVAVQVLPQHQAYEWHQALMDLGATVCLWSRPRCIECPLMRWCRARHPFEANQAVAEPQVPYRVQPRFSGSRRYYRGKTVSLLRELAPDELMSLESLGPRLKPDWDMDWLISLVAGLERDGLICLTEAGINLP